MQEQKVFIAEDGRRFDSKDSCLLYELECAQIEKIMAALEPRPDDLKFSNGYSGYIQHQIP